MGNSQFPSRDFHPIGQAALWAANRVERERGMFRLTASSVSNLSVFVANSRQALHPFLPSPLKFRTVGFPQYGFKRASAVNLHRQPELPTYMTVTPASFSSATCCPVIMTFVPSERASCRVRPARPVALGSATGYSVRLPHRLLWPHLSLWRSNAAYHLLIPRC